MLVLRRRPGESIILGGAIRITVLEVFSDRVKLGIDAPPDVIIVREELLDRAIPATYIPKVMPAGEITPIIPTITER